MEQEYRLTVFAEFENDEERELYMKNHVIPFAIPNGGKITSWSDENEGHYRDLCAELLEALENILSQYKIHFQSHADLGDDLHAYIIDLSEQAIAKAKGETQC